VEVKIVSNGAVFTPLRGRLGVRGNRNPRTGFGSFARTQKNIFAKLKFMQKSTLETYGLNFHPYY